MVPASRPPISARWWCSGDANDEIALRLCTSADRRAVQRPNTYSIEATDMVLSSGNSASVCDVCLDPTSTAIYCLPLTEYVIGGAVKPVPALKLQSGCSVFASNA